MHSPRQSADGQDDTSLFPGSLDASKLEDGPMTATTYQSQENSHSRPNSSGNIEKEREPILNAPGDSTDQLIHSPTPYRPLNVIEQWKHTVETSVQDCETEPVLLDINLSQPSHLVVSADPMDSVDTLATDAYVLEHSSFGDLVNFAPLSPNALAAIVDAHSGLNSDAFDNSGQSNSSDSLDSELTLADSLRTNTTSLSTTMADSLSSPSTGSSLFISNASPASPFVLGHSSDDNILTAPASPTGIPRTATISPLPPSSPPMSSSPAPFHSDLSQPSSQTSLHNSITSQGSKDEEQTDAKDGDTGFPELDTFVYAGDDLYDPSMKESKSISLVHLEVSGNLQAPIEDVNYNAREDILVPSTSEPIESSPQPAAYKRNSALGEKRKADEDPYDSVPAKRQATAPTTYRVTQAMHQKQRKKLVAPFRSPVVDAAKAASRGQASNASSAQPVTECQIQPPVEQALPKDSRIRHRTLRAAAQFKSPLATSNLQTNNTIRLTPTIQALERQVQNLKRAVKVKEQDEEAELKGLILKWREAGQEAAYEVWAVVRESAQPNTTESNPWAGWGEEKGDKKRGFEETWGWSEQGDEKKRCTEEQNRAMDQDVEMEERPQETMGTMLRRLGIVPETLGWDEKAEYFV